MHIFIQNKAELSKIYMVTKCIDVLKMSFL